MEWRNEFTEAMGNISILLMNAVLVIKSVEEMQKDAPKGMEKPLARLKQYAKNMEDSIDEICDLFSDLMDAKEETEKTEE